MLTGSPSKTIRPVRRRHPTLAIHLTRGLPSPHRVVRRFPFLFRDSRNSPQSKWSSLNRPRSLQGFLVREWSCLRRSHGRNNSHNNSHNNRSRRSGKRLTLSSQDFCWAQHRRTSFLFVSIPFPDSIAFPLR